MLILKWGYFLYNSRIYIFHLPVLSGSTAQTGCLFFWYVTKNCRCLKKYKQLQRVISRASLWKRITHMDKHLDTHMWTQAGKQLIESECISITRGHLSEGQRKVNRCEKETPAGSWTEQSHWCGIWKKQTTVLAQLGDQNNKLCSF